MDKATRSRFTKGMLRWSAALEQMHISAKDTFDLVNKAIEGDEDALTVLAYGGVDIAKFQQAIQAGDIEAAAKMYNKAVIKIGSQLKRLPPMARKYMMETIGITDEMASSFIEAANNAQELQTQTRKAFSVKVVGGEAQRQWEESVNPFTRGLQKLQNEFMAVFGDKIPTELLDSFSDLDSILLLAISSKFLLGKAKKIGGLAGKSLVDGMKKVLTKARLPFPKMALPLKSGEAFKFKNVFKILGKYGGKAGIVGTALIGGITLGSALMEKEEKEVKVAKAVGSIGGSIGGGALGAAIGSSILPGPGTVIGGIIGSILGGLIGESAGEQVGKVIEYEGKKSLKQNKPILERVHGRIAKESQGSVDEILNAIYKIQKQLSSIDANTAFIVQLNKLMDQYIELLKMIAKQSGQSIDESVFKGFSR